MTEFFTATMGTQFATILVGLAVLTLGRKLFWLATGVTGFIVGLGFVIQVAGDQPPLVLLIVAVITGIIGAVLAILLQKAAVGLAGLLLGGFTLVSMVDLLELGLGQWSWILFIIGAVIGLILALTLLEPALILISAVAGALLIVQAVDFSPVVIGVLFVVLLVLGIIIQWRMWPEAS
ncbi:MAG: DUF4203 domain-containing protein [Anaerolineae bacterium]|nr:DUF4203 domain-containing protein [Anaerolineae bacterium]